MSARLVVLASTVALFVGFSVAPDAQEDRPARAQAACPQEPARFHPCALEKAKTFTPPERPLIAAAASPL